jgi:hypothetical protein
MDPRKFNRTPLVLLAAAPERNRTVVVLPVVK